MVQYQHPFSNPDLADGWGSWAGGRSQAHRGLDYPQAADTPIPAVADGTVRHNVWNDALGWVLVIAHADGVFSGYSHMIRQSPLAVGASVARGQIIGNVGNEGTASQGNHLHLTITYTHDGTWNNGDLSVTTDPWVYINARLSGTPTPTTATEENDVVIYEATSNSTDGLIAKGQFFIQGAAGPLRWMSALEKGSYDYWASNGIPYRRAPWSGNDIRQLVTMVGLFNLGAQSSMNGQLLIGSNPLKTIGTAY